MHSVGVSAAPVLGFSFAFLLPWLLIQRPAGARTVSAVFDQSWMRMCWPLRSNQASPWIGEASSGLVLRIVLVYAALSRRMLVLRPGTYQWPVLTHRQPCENPRLATL